jgi:hypothetical protein
MLILLISASISNIFKVRLYYYDGYRTIENVIPFWPNDCEHLKLTKNSPLNQKNLKSDTIENEIMCNVAIVCHIIYLAYEKFSIHTTNILEKSHKLIIIIVYK